MTFAPEFEGRLKKYQDADGAATGAHITQALRETITPEAVSRWFKKGLIEDIENTAVKGIAGGPDFLHKLAVYLDRHFEMSAVFLRTAEDTAQRVISIALGVTKVVVGTVGKVSFAVIHVVVAVARFIFKLAAKIIYLIVRYGLIIPITNLIGVSAKPLLLLGLSEPSTKNVYGPSNGAEVLRNIRRMPIYRFSYRFDPARNQYLGPMAPDFHALFGEFQANPHFIAIPERQGVLMAAVHELAMREAMHTREIDELRERLSRVN